MSLSSLEVENASLQCENKFLRAENNKLRERLGLNSRNSSIPTSRELYKLKPSNTKSKRSKGGQAGHVGSYRKRAIADDTIELEVLSKTCECGGFLGSDGAPYVIQKAEIAEIKPYISEYRLCKKRCLRCGRRSSATLPYGIDKDLLGPRAKTIVSSLTGFYKNSKREVQNILQDVFNLKISLGSISNIEGRVSERCKDNYDLIEQAISYSDVLHIDETSHYNQGKLHWCWLYSNKTHSLIKFAKSRSKKVLEDSVVGKDDCVIVSDRYAVYNYFNMDNRQCCWSHLSRDFSRFANSWNPDVKLLGGFLENISRELFAIRKSLSSHEIDLITFLRRAKKLRRRCFVHLKKILVIEEAIGAVRVAKNILKCEDMMWKFIEDPMNIPLTNNHAERQIKHYVVYRKNSYFTQSDRGDRFLERIISSYSSWKQQNLNPFQHLLDLIQNASQLPLN